MSNETKHTPGPWETSTDYMEISPSSGPKSHVELARIVGPGEGSSFYTYDEASANARLIAAAPELLAACKALLAEVGDVVCSFVKEAHGDVCETDPCGVCAMEHAIAKAEGR